MGSETMTPTLPCRHYRHDPETGKCADYRLIHDTNHICVSVFMSNMKCLWQGVQVSKPDPGNRRLKRKGAR